MADLIIDVDQLRHAQSLGLTYDEFALIEGTNPAHRQAVYAIAGAVDAALDKVARIQHTPCIH